MGFYGFLWFDKSPTVYNICSSRYDHSIALSFLQVDLISFSSFPLEDKFRNKVSSWIRGDLCKDSSSFASKAVTFFDVSVHVFERHCFLSSGFVLMKGHLIPVYNWGIDSACLQKEIFHCPHIF